MARRTCECGECRKCKHREYMNAWYRRPGSADRVRGWAKRYRDENAEKVRAYDSTRRRDRDPLKNRAHRAVSRALELGLLERPTACEACGGDPGTGSDGRSLIQAHHPDHRQPLVVRWLCVACHGAEHRRVA